MTERLLGTSADGFAVLRVESDNQGSYYTTGVKHYLDVYAKEAPEKRPDIATKVSTVLLLDQTYARHPDAKADAPPEVKTNEKAETGEAVSLPVLIAKFPQMPEKWAAEDFQKLEAHPTGGVSAGRANMLWGGWVKERFGVDRNAEFDWKLEDVMEDSNCLFLKVSCVDDSDWDDTRWICILPKTTEQIRARLSMNEFYLVAGTFETEEEAVALATKINAINKKQNSYKFTPEVWAEQTPADKIRYRVVSGLTKDAVGGDSFAKLEGIFGVDFEVVSSTRFKKRIFFK